MTSPDTEHTDIPPTWVVDGKPVPVDTSTHGNDPEQGDAVRDDPEVAARQRKFQNAVNAAAHLREFARTFPAARHHVGTFVHDVDRLLRDAGLPPLTADQLEWAKAAVDAKQEHSRLVSGDVFALDVPTTPPALWGDGDEVLWADGEPMLITGPIGVGKSTLMLQLVLARIGVGDGTLLGYPVQPASGKVLHVAADRPRQIARNINRMVTEDDRDKLRDRLIVHRGALPFDIGQHPERLAGMCRELGVSDVYLDSLKDVAVDLAKDEQGSRVAQAFQRVVDTGVNLASNHHNVKGDASGREPKELRHVYGSTLITAKVGTVVSLYGEAGDPVVAFRMLKLSMADVGPIDVELTEDGGVVIHEGGRSLWAILQGSTAGIDKKNLARMLYDTEKPTRSQETKVGRQLTKWENAGKAHRKEGKRGGRGGSEPDLWFPVTDATPPAEDG